MYVVKKQADLSESKKANPVLLVFPFGHLSHYLRCLTLAKHFSPYFDVLFAYHDRYAGFLEKENVKTFDCLSLDAGQALACAKRFDFSWLNEKALEAVYLAQVKAIERFKPVAVLGDTSPTLKMAAEATGVLYISLMNGYMSKHFSLTRKLSRTHPGYKLLNLFPGPVMDLFTRAGEYVAFYQVHKPFKKIRERHMLSPVKNYLDEMEGNINLVCDLPELFPQQVLPADYTLISPLYYEGPAVSTGIARRLDKTKKTIFVSMGSTGDWNNVCFLNHPAFQRYNVVAAGDTEKVLHAAHIISTGFVNIQEIFPFTDLVICHGGNGTMYQALAYGIPILCKTSHFEQEWNVFALERLKLGISLDEIRFLPEYITLIAEWIDKKGKATEDCINNLNAQRNRLPEVVSRIAFRIIEYANPACN